MLLVALTCLTFNQYTGRLLTCWSRYLGERLPLVLLVATPFCGLKEGIRGIKILWPPDSFLPKYQTILNNRGLRHLTSKMLHYVVVEHVLSYFHNKNEFTKLNLLTSGHNSIFVYKLQYKLTSKIDDFILLTWLQTNYYVTHKPLQLCIIITKLDYIILYHN